MKRHWAGAVLLLALSAALILVPAKLRAAAAAGQGGLTLPWMQPPPEFREMQQQGFHAGVQAAIKDYDHHRDPDLERHREYVHPKVDRSYLPDFRDGYRRGYNDAMKHLIKAHGQAS